MSGPDSSSPASLFSAVSACLQRAEAAQRDGRAPALTEAAEACATLIALCEAGPAQAAGQARLVAALWLKRGHLLEARGEPADGIEALYGYDRVIALLASDGAPESVEVRAGAWLNRGNTLRRLASPNSAAEAIRSYEHTIAELASRAEDRAVRPILAAAWSNLGLVRLAQGDAPSAVESQARAFALVSADAERGAEAVMFLLHLGEARAIAGEPAAALEVFRQVLAAVADWETRDLAALATGLRARDAACRVLAAQLEAEGTEVTEATHARLAEAAALVGGGLELMRLRGAGAGGAARAAGARLFEFGAWLYRSFGTGQLAPYLAEYAVAAEFPERAAIARAAIAEVRRELLGRGFERLTGEAAEQAVAELADLREVEARFG